MLFHLHLVTARCHVDFILFQRDGDLLIRSDPTNGSIEKRCERVFGNID